MNHNKPVIQQQEEPSFTSFNVQSSAFFNNHLSSKSSDQMTSSLFNSKHKAKFL